MLFQHRSSASEATSILDRVNCLVHAPVFPPENRSGLSTDRKLLFGEWGRNQADLTSEPVSCLRDTPLLGISQRGDRDEDFSGDRAGNFRLLLPQKTDFPRLELYATAQPFPAGDQFQEKTGSLS